MTKFDNYESAEAFAEIRSEEIEKDEHILIMSKGNEYVVTSDYNEAKRNGYKYVAAFYN